MVIDTSFALSLRAGARRRILHRSQVEGPPSLKLMWASPDSATLLQFAPSVSSCASIVELFGALCSFRLSNIAGSHLSILPGGSIVNPPKPSPGAPCASRCCDPGITYLVYPFANKETHVSHICTALQGILRPRSSPCSKVHKDFQHVLVP